MGNSKQTYTALSKLACSCAVVLLAACGGGEEASSGSSADTTSSTATAQPRTTLAATMTTTSWVRCAVENATCTVPTTSQVRYGLDGKYNTKTITGSTPCTNAVFGDPYPGANKVCDYSQTTTTAPAPAPDTSTTWTRCAEEYGTCNFSGTRQVRYGADGKYATMTATSSIGCNNNVFGDPYPGVKKACDYATSTTTSSPAAAPAPAPTTTTWTRCANENATCTVPSTRQVRYGANGTYAYRTITGSTACSNGVFGDPLPGVVKACDYENTTAATTPTPTQSSTPGPYGQDASLYTLAFADEFNSYNSTVWNDAIWYESSNATKNYTVEDGKLKIWPQRDASGKFFNRTIDTDGKYYQTYGYFEMEAKLVEGKGTWPAFWLLNHDSGTNIVPEIDIMEAYGGAAPNTGWSDGNGNPTTYATTVWPQGINGGPQAGFKMHQNLGDLSNSFHKYAVKWEPNKITFYFDGKEVHVVNVSMNKRSYILLDLWYGSASGTPDNTTPTGKGNAFEINYVRAWKFK